MSTHYQRVAGDEAANNDIPLGEWDDSSPSQFPEPVNPSDGHPLAWGLTMVPRVNVLVSLICQRMIDSGELKSPAEATAAAAAASPAVASLMLRDSMPSMDDKSGLCSSPQVISGVAFLSTYRDLVTGILGAVMSYVLGKLSDRLGRVKILALNGLGVSLADLVLLLVVAFPRVLDYRWLFLSFAIDGLSGSYPLLAALTSSYMADTTTDADRVGAMGWMQSGMFLGMAVGPSLGTALSSLTPDKPAAIFLYAMLCRGLGLLCLFFLPESVPAGGNKRLSTTETLRPMVSGRRAPWKVFVAFLKSTFSPSALDGLLDPDLSAVDLRQRRRNLSALIAVTAVMFGTSVGAMDVLMLYPQARFHWTMMDTGSFVTVVSVCRALASTLVLSLLLRLFRHGFNKSFFFRSSSSNTQPQPQQPPRSGDYEIKHAHLPLLRLSLAADLLGYLGFGFASSTALFVVAGILSSLSALSLSASQASMSMLVSPEHVGKLMGVVGSIQALTRLVSPPIINSIYGWAVGSFPQGIFFGLAGCVLAGLGVTFMIRLA